MTTATPGTWFLWIGLGTGDAAEWLNQHVRAHPPVLVWCEPLNGRSRRVDVGLLDPAAMSSLPKGILAEARLFYDDGLLHVLAAPDGWRFAAWREGEDRQKPDWCPADAKPVAQTTDRHEEPTSHATVLRTVSERTILLNASAGLRGLDVTHVGQRVTAVEYYESGVLRWWRLKRHG